MVAKLTRVFKPRAMRGVLAAMKVRGMALYTQNAPHPMPTRVDDIGKRHQNGAAGNALRAGVFGINDGLVSNAALIYGVAGAAPEPSIIVLTGVAGLLAGAFSMASGEYVSVRSQREMFEYQIGLERDELEEYPQEEAAELALIYDAKGMDPTEARRLAGGEVGLSPHLTFVPRAGRRTAGHSWCCDGAIRPCHPRTRA